MALGIDDLLKPSTTDEIKAQIYQLLEGLGVSTTSWLAGAPTRTVIAVVSAVLSGFTNLAVTIARSGFLDTAEGGWLTLLALLVYNVTRVEATFATGEVTLDNTAGGVFSFGAGEVIFKNTATSKTYVNVAPFTLGALETGKVVAVVAQELGTDSNAAPGQIDALVTTLTGVTVTNALAVVGVDAELDPDLRQRCRDSLGALSPNGPRAAYEYVAKTPELNGGVAVTRVKRLTPPGDGTLTIVIAGPAGPVGGATVALVQTGIDEHATPEVVTATVADSVAKPFTRNVTLHVSAAAGLTTTDWQTLAKAALADYVAQLAIGGLVLPPATSGVVPWRALVGELEAIEIDEVRGYVLHASLDTEADVALLENEVATLDTGTVTVTVVQVAA